MTSSDLDRLVSRAKDLATGGDAGAALLLATELVGKYPTEAKVWSLRAHLHSLNRNYAQSVADLTCAIEVDPLQPAFFFQRGWSRLRLGDDQSAINDFSEGLNLCDYHENDYYRESLHFMRAEAYLRLGKKSEGLADLAHVREDFTVWTYKLRSKTALLAECRNLPK